MTFAYPIFAAAALPLLLLLWIHGRRRRSPAVPIAAIAPHRTMPRTWRAALRAPLLNSLVVLTAAALLAAAARPQYVQLLFSEEQARNIMLSVDLSRSMATRDFHSNQGMQSRLAGVKTVLNEFILGRPSDRIGVVVFGERAFLQVPLTRDAALVTSVIKKLESGIAGDGTAIGEGLGLAIKRVYELRQGARAIVLVTDGVNNAGAVEPLQAAHVAKDLGIKVHTIGIGSVHSAGAVSMSDLLLGRGVPQAEFDEATLRKIAEITGGVYFHADNIERLRDVYSEIDALETTDAEAPPPPIAEELFPRFLIWALCGYLALILAARTIWLTVP